MQHVHGMLRQVALLEISRGSLLTRVVGSGYTVCNAAKNGLPTKLLEGETYRKLSKSDL